MGTLLNGLVRFVSKHLELSYLHLNFQKIPESQTKQIMRSDLVCHQSKLESCKFLNSFPILQIVYILISYINISVNFVIFHYFINLIKYYFYTVIKELCLILLLLHTQHNNLEQNR